MASSDPALDTETLLRPEDFGDADALVREAGWNQVDADWRIFLDLGKVFAVRATGGRVIATAAVLPFDGFGWISMVLVAGEFRRRGLASRLMRRCIDELIAGGRVPVLDATPDGRQVYRALGFEDTWSFHRFTLRERGPAPAAGSAASRDRHRADRRRRLAASLRTTTRRRSAPTAARCWRVCADGCRPANSWRCATAASRAFCWDATAGPARSSGRWSPTTMRLRSALLARALAAVAGPLYVDVADAHPAIRAWLEARGFTTQRPLTRMVYRRRTGFDDPARTYAVVGPEFG